MNKYVMFFLLSFNAVCFSETSTIFVGGAQTSTATLRSEVNVVVSDPDSNTRDLTFSASSEQTFSFACDSSYYIILYGYVVLDGLGSYTADYDAEITFYSAGTYSGRDAVYRVAADIISTQVSATTTVGTAGLTVSDSTSFTGNQLVIITSSSGEEKARVETVNTATHYITLEDGLQYAHPGLESRVYVGTDFGGQIVYCDRVYGSISIAPSLTGTLRLELLVK